MPHPNRLARGLFSITLLLGLIFGLVGPSLIRAQAAPKRQASNSVVISEFRTTGPTGGTDEFIELYNPTSSTVPLTGMMLRKSSACGSIVSGNLYVFGPVSLVSGQHYLIGGAGYSGSVAPDAPSQDLSLANDGGIAIVDPSDTPLDQVGLCATTGYKEGTNLPAMSGTSNQSYERKNSGCTDTNDNFSDFFLNQTSSNPQNSTSIPVPCLRVVDVNSTNADNTYFTGDTIQITVTFSSNVNVTGSPQLLLETGLNDRNAVYTAGSGTNVLLFTYTVQAQDASRDLDYVATNSLTLNGGTIVGAVGNANLTLPSPGTPGSLGANRNIIIDNQLPPAVFINQSAGQPDPTGSLPINFSVVFSEPIDNSTFSNADITQNGTATGIVWNIADSGDHMNFTLSATAVTVAGTLVPSIASNQVFDFTNRGNIASVSTDNSVAYENIPPKVDVNQAATQTDPAHGPPVNFSIVFSEPIDATTFTTADITQNGTISSSLITWSIADSGDHTNFTLSATIIAGKGTIVPSIAAGLVKDAAGNLNLVSTSTDNSVDYDDNIAPSVTINQASTQADPTNALPVKFTVVFSEPIIPNLFTPSDITQNGTATGITWNIADSGDHKTFTLSATAITGVGTVIPSIAANSVLDFTLHNNTASTSTDNSVVYETSGPTVTVNQAVGQADPTNLLPIRFTVVFSEPINGTTFTAADITQSGTAAGITWSIVDSGDHMTFTLSATALTRNGTLVPSIGANKVTDLAGNNNSASSSTDNVVTSTIVLPTPTGTVHPTATPTPTLGVIISEVAWMGTLASATDEWIEIYNPGAVDMNGWTLRSTDGVINITINHAPFTNPYDPYYILAPSSAFTDVVIDQNISATFDNGGKSLELRNAVGVLIDTANSDGGSWPAGIASPTYATMERHAGSTLDTAANWYTFAGTPTKHDRNNNLVRGTPGYSNWAATVTATPTKVPTPTRTPTRANVIVATVAPTVVINEFLPRAGFDWNRDGKVDVFDEFIEVANLGPINVNLAGWKLDDEAGKGSNPYTLPSITLKPGERMVFYGSQTNIHLSDGGDTVRLLNPNNVIKDAKSYSVVTVADQSTCRLPDINGSWYSDCFPTPNQRNTHTGQVPAAAPGTGLEAPVCLLPDTLPDDFRLAECFGYGTDMWQSAYWDKLGWWQGDHSVPQNGSKWDTFIE